MNDVSENPRISVVIPCYNGAPYLSEAIESCLRQTMTDFEIVIVDDASPDDCAQIAERFARSDPRIRLIRREKNGGVSAAFNSGFAVARGRFFTRLAQDDVFYPDALAKLCGAWKRAPIRALCTAAARRSTKMAPCAARQSSPSRKRRCSLAIAWGCVLRGGARSGKSSAGSIRTSMRPRITNTGCASGITIRSKAAGAHLCCEPAGMRRWDRCFTPSDRNRRRFASCASRFPRGLRRRGGESWPSGRRFRGRSLGRRHNIAGRGRRDWH